MILAPFQEQFPDIDTRGGTPTGRNSTLQGVTIGIYEMRFYEERNAKEKDPILKKVQIYQRESEESTESKEGEGKSTEREFLRKARWSLI